MDSQGAVVKAPAKKATVEPFSWDLDSDRRVRFEMMKRIEEIGVDPGRIEDRLRALDREWDVESVLQTKGAFLSVWGTAMGLSRNRVWFLLPALVGGLLFQQVVQGQSPVSAALRRFGLRTRREIEQERALLKALRGDFDRVQEASAFDAVEAARK